MTLHHSKMTLPAGVFGPASTWVPEAQLKAVQTTLDEVRARLAACVESERKLASQLEQSRLRIVQLTVDRREAQDRMGQLHRELRDLADVQVDRLANRLFTQAVKAARAFFSSR